MKKNKEAFSVFVNKDGEYTTKQSEANDLQEVKLAVLRPNHAITMQGQAEFSKAVMAFANDGVMLRVQVEDIAKARNLWSDAKQAEADALNKAIDERVLLIKRGGCKLSEAVNAAKEIIKDRNKLFVLTIDKNELDKHTAESLAENLRFDYLVSNCAVYEDSGAKVFASYDDFVKQREEHPVLTDAASEAMFKLTTGINEDFRKDWPEYQFLLKHGFCDEKLRLKRKSDGKLVDLESNLVNQEGRRVNEEGKFIDRGGQVVDDKGEPQVEFRPFIED